MYDTLIFLPILTLVSLTLGLYIYLAVAKAQASKLGQVNEERRALYNDAWPENVQKINNSIRNQFEIPVLFYILIFVNFSAELIDITTHILAWLFVASRFFHAYIHTGSNFIPLRRRFFMMGCFIIFAMIVVTAGKLLL